MESADSERAPCHERGDGERAENGLELYFTKTRTFRHPTWCEQLGDDGEYCLQCDQQNNEVGVRRRIFRAIPKQGDVPKQLNNGEHAEIVA